MRITDDQITSIDDVALAAAEQAPEAPVRKFAKELNPEPPEPMVRCKVTRRGGDKISTGRHEPILGDEKYAEGEIITLPLSIARVQQDELNAAGEPRGYVEILD